MRIDRLEFHDLDNDWHLEEVSFGKLSLLVGVSGAGKTRILKAINTLFLIANGYSFSGINWDIKFSIEKGVNYRWKGEFYQNSKLPLNGRNGEDKTAILKSENLWENGIPVFERKGSEIKFGAAPVPKLSQEESLLVLLMEEPTVMPAKNGFSKIIFPPSTYDFNLLLSLSKPVNEHLLEAYNHIDIIRSGGLNLKLKLFFTSVHASHVFEEIKSDFANIFPLVEDIKSEPLPNYHIYGREPVLQIKERHVNRWIPQTEIAQGMLKTLLLLAEIHLCPDGSVILIDEFENSLGVNCIDEVTAAIMSPGRDLQFIITSHHPYIINNIDMEYWKVVTRHGNTVKVLDAADLNLGKSRHTAFTQLLNLEAYRTGVAA